jgi:hypothetical protein
MSTLKERLEATLGVIDSSDISLTEYVVHLYYFFSFERQIVKRNRAHHKAEKLKQKIDENLEVFIFRKQMSDHP